MKKSARTHARAMAKYFADCADGKIIDDGGEIRCGCGCKSSEEPTCDCTCRGKNHGLMVANREEMLLWLKG